MIYELRSYAINPDTWDDFRAWGLNRAFPVLFERFNLPLVGFFENVSVADIKDEAFNRTVGVHWILAWDSVEERHQRMTELRASREWRTATLEAKDEKGQERFFVNACVTFLKAWPGSPIQ